MLILEVIINELIFLHIGFVIVPDRKKKMIFKDEATWLDSLQVYGVHADTIRKIWPAFIEFKNNEALPWAIKK